MVALRKPEYLSPTSIGVFLEDREAFARKYLITPRPPKEPQTQAMAIGSAFDAYVKSFLHEKFFGKGANPQYELPAIFEKQVEPHNRDWAWGQGKYVFDEYCKSGALADLMLDLNQCVGKPRFEFEIKDTITTQVGEVPLLGKPDIFFINKMGGRCIYDWKVNGYMSPRNTSPMKGYLVLRPSRAMHKDCFPVLFNGIKINAGHKLDDCNKEWARQITIYSWLLGEPVGSEEMVAGIDQIVGPATSMRFATHRMRISADFQRGLLATIEEIWRVIDSGIIFPELSKEENDSRLLLMAEEAQGRGQDPTFDILTN